MLHAWSLSAWGRILSPRKGKSFFMGLVESAAYFAVLKTNEGLKSARQEDPTLCFQVPCRACTACTEGAEPYWRRWPRQPEGAVRLKQGACLQQLPDPGQHRQRWVHGLPCRMAQLEHCSMSFHPPRLCCKVLHLKAVMAVPPETQQKNNVSQRSI